MTTGKRCEKISELVRDGSAEGDSFVEELAEQISKRRLVRLLATLRDRHSVTQEQVAHNLDCQQSRISKLENGFDEDVTIKDLVGYAKAANSDLGIVFKSRDLSLVDVVKAHACGIKRCLEKLNDLAKDDFQIAKGIANFHVETLVNLAVMIAKSARHLHKSQQTSNEPEVAIQVQEPEPALAGTKCPEPQAARDPLSV
ncbi:MAG: transcriptional regulator [Planctomycetia bacterium]|nr:transcriptional regulator [Planctomycetia bacterium]